jgi:hypothetical protein
MVSRGATILLLLRLAAKLSYVGGDVDGVDSRLQWPMNYGR